MHKYFAKPLFLGKKVEFLPECHSTNEEMMARAKQGLLQEGHVIYTDYQQKGKGQRGNAWISAPGENLLFSLYLQPDYLLPGQAYYLNIISGLAVAEAIALTAGITAEIKWPNDVYGSDRKICGILVETIIDRGTVEGAVVGIGVNVNQSHFALPEVTSVRMISGRKQDRYELLERIMVILEAYVLKLKAGELEGIIGAYYRLMRWRGEVHEFRDVSGIFQGEIIGIDDRGRLTVKVNDHMRRYDVKEITFVH